MKKIFFGILISCLFTSLAYGVLLSKPSDTKLGSSEINTLHPTQFFGCENCSNPFLDELDREGKALWNKHEREIWGSGNDSGEAESLNE